MSEESGRLEVVLALCTPRNFFEKIFLKNFSEEPLQGFSFSWRNPKYFTQKSAQKWLKMSNFKMVDTNIALLGKIFLRPFFFLLFKKTAFCYCWNELVWKSWPKSLQKRGVAIPWLPINVGLAAWRPLFRKNVVFTVFEFSSEKCQNSSEIFGKSAEKTKPTHRTTVFCWDSYSYHRVLALGGVCTLSASRENVLPAVWK